MSKDSICCNTDVTKPQIEVMTINKGTTFIDYYNALLVKIRINIYKIKHNRNKEVCVLKNMLGLNAAKLFKTLND